MCPIDEKTLKLRSALYFCTYSENYYTNKNLSYQYTDGVKIFCETAGTYWLLDLVENVIKFKKELISDTDLITITLIVKEDYIPKIAFRKGVKIIHYQDIPYTDCPIGKWKFCYRNKVLFWNTEYEH